jgi:hypothetical protein
MDFESEHWLTDPRPDVGGGDVWEGLFSLEFPISGHDAGGLYGTIRGLRCLGAGSRRAANGTIRLLPPADMDREVFAAFLEPHRDHLADLLGRLDDEPEPAPVLTMPRRRRAVLLSKEV